MRFIRSALARIAGAFTRDHGDDDLRDEFRAHLEMETAEYIRRGMSPDEARRQALLSAGGLVQAEEAVRAQRGLPWLDSLGSDLRYAVRALRRAKGFSVVVVLTLALGIGANTAMFTLLRGTLLRPLPNRDGSRLLYLRQSAQITGRDNAYFSVPEVADYRAATHTLSTIAEYSSMTFTMIGKDGDPMHVRTGIVTGNYFHVMGLEPALGRLLNEQDDGAAAIPATVLSYQFWQERMGGDPHVVGQQIRINDKASTIVGVVQLAPLYPQKTDVFVNLVTSPHHLSATMVTDRSHRMSDVFARLAPNATLEQAREEMQRISDNIYRDHPEAYQKAARYGISVMPLRDAINERASLTLWILMGSAAFVLLIACANVANLTLMRGVGREREMLVRAALGAGTFRLRRLLLIENLTLALFGGVLGIIVAGAGLKLLVAFATQLTPRAYEIRVDGLVLAVGILTSIAAAVVLAFIPRIGGEHVLAVSLAPSGKRTTLGRGRQRFQRSLVVTQLAVCMVLLSGAGLLVRTLTKLQAVNTGVRTDHVLTLQMPVDIALDRFVQQQMEYQVLFTRVRDRVATLPGVEMVGLGTSIPLRRAAVDFDLKAEDRPVAADEPTPHAYVKAVSPQYFGAAGIPILSGRSFQSTDDRTAGHVVILNQSLAKKLFGDLDPVGRRIAWTGEVLKFSPISGDWRTVVGVVGDTRDQGLDGDPAPTVYSPFWEGPILNGGLVIRTAGDPALLQVPVMRAIREIAPKQLIERVMTLDKIRDDAVAPRRLNALFIVSFGTLALLIAMVGIAGVLAFSVSSRTAEIGIRMSLGAEARRVRRMILGEGGILLVAGLVFGTVGALAVTRLLAGMLFGVSAHDPETFAAVAGVLAAIGLAACWVPAARAARVDPAVALRAE